MIDPKLAQRCRVTEKDELLTAFDGKFCATPEMLRDFESYYNITAEDILSLILDLEKQGLVTGEVDIFVKLVSGMRPNKETIFQFAITVEGAKVYESYFSAQPFDWIAYAKHSSQP